MLESSLYTQLKGFPIKKKSLYALYVAIAIVLVFLSVATIIGDYGLVGDFGIAFANINITIFGYVAYIYLPLLLYPLYCVYKKPKLTFARLESIVSASLFFVALLLFQSLTLQKGLFGNALVLLLREFIGYFGVCVLDLCFFVFAWLISTKRNIDTIIKQVIKKLVVVYDFTALIANYIYNASLELTNRAITYLKPYAQRLFMPKTQDIIDLQRAKEEAILNAKYDFSDVELDTPFDETSQKPTQAQIYAAKTKMETQAESSQDSNQVSSPNATHNAPTQAQNSADSTTQDNQYKPSPYDTMYDAANLPPKPIQLEVVQNEKSTSLADFLKNQLHKHKDMLQNIKVPKHIALAEPAIKPILKEQYMQDEALKLDSTPHNAPYSENSALESAAHNLHTSPSGIPTPPPRAINPSVFMQPSQADIDKARIRQENIKAAHPKIPHPSINELLSTQEVESTPPIIEAPTQVPQSMETIAPEPPEPIIYDDNLQTQMPQFDSIRLDSIAQPTQSAQENAESAPNILESSQDSTPQATSQTQTSPNIMDIEIQEIAESSQDSAPQDAQHTTPQALDSIDSAPQATAQMPQSAPQTLFSAQSAQMPQATQTPQQGTLFQSAPKPQRISELEENNAALNTLDYGKMPKPLNFRLPSTSLLEKPNDIKADIDESEIDRKIEDLLAKLKVFKIEGDIVRTYSGPIVTTFEFRPAPHVKVGKILTLEDDLAMALKARSIRIQAPIPGKDVVGIEIPNNTTQMIHLREVLESDRFKASTSPLTLALGKDIVGNPFITDLKLLPHLLIAGTTGSGKSVGINAMILSLLYKNTPENLKLLMIDPKRVEFSAYTDIPHLITPIITQPKKAIIGLNSAMAEMDRRYELMAELRTKDIDSYNRKILSEGGEKFPYLVIIIDELADLMMTGGKEVEFALARIAQMGRASGIHIIVATQRPSVDIITGLIKTNLPSRISYKVGSKIDSKVILDTLGAESLLGNGDMLFTPPSVGGVIRLHAPWVGMEEIEGVANFIKSQQEAIYDRNFMLDEKDNLVSNEAELSADDSAWVEKAKNVIIQDRKTSVSYLQRRLAIGYNKAANIVEMLEKIGFLSAPNAKGVREILGQ